MFQFLCLRPLFTLIRPEEACFKYLDNNPRLYWLILFYFICEVVLTLNLSSYALVFFLSCSFSILQRPVKETVMAESEKPPEPSEEVSILNKHESSRSTDLLVAKD